MIINGYTQEAYCVFRTLDEFNEDINFLVIPIVTGSESDDHKRFIDYMFREERWVGGVDCFVEKKRPSIPREKIQKAIAKSAAHLADPADTKKSHTTLQAAFSGFVHGAANHILDLYGGNPPRFHVKGTRGTPRDAESLECAGNYFHRSLLSMMLISTALGNESVHRTLSDFLKYFESRTDVV